MYLTADDVIAATRDTMEATIDYISDKHGGIVPYLQDVRRPLHAAKPLLLRQGICCSCTPLWLWGHGRLLWAFLSLGCWKGRAPKACSSTPSFSPDLALTN